MKFSIIVPSLLLILSTVTALALPNEQDLVARDDNDVPKLNLACLIPCVGHKSVAECRKICDH